MEFVEINFSLSEGGDHKLLLERVSGNTSPGSNGVDGKKWVAERLGG